LHSFRFFRHWAFRLSGILPLRHFAIPAFCHYGFSPFRHFVITFLWHSDYPAEVPFAGLPKRKTDFPLAFRSFVVTLQPKLISTTEMSFFSRLFGKKKAEDTKVGGMEDYMTLVRVYLQAIIAERLGITNLAMLPDLRTFKTTLKVATVNNKLGPGEKSRCKKMMKEIYNTDDLFFKEIDATVKKNCKRLQDLQPFMFQFQGFTQDLMMLLGNLMKFKLRLPSFFKKALYTMTEKTVADIFNKNDYSDPGVVKTVMAVRQYNNRLGFSQKWVTDFVYQVVMLAKKEPKPAEEPTK